MLSRHEFSVLMCRNKSVSALFLSWRLNSVGKSSSSSDSQHDRWSDGAFENSLLYNVDSVLLNCIRTNGDVVDFLIQALCPGLSYLPLYFRIFIYEWLEKQTFRGFPIYNLTYVIEFTTPATTRATYTPSEVKLVVIHTFALSAIILVIRVIRVN